MILRHSENLKYATHLETPDTQSLTKCNKLNYFLNDCIQYGQVSEWGMPWGHMTRYLLLLFLAESTQKGGWCLWLHNKKEMEIYAPAWQAYGVDLQKFRASYFQDSISDLRPIFMSDFFKIIIIDGKVSQKEFAFLAKQARAQKQLIFVIHDHLISGKFGNVWCKTRFNSWYEPISERLYLRTLKGLSSRQISFKASELW